MGTPVSRFIVQIAVMGACGKPGRKHPGRSAPRKGSPRGNGLVLALHVSAYVDAGQPSESCTSLLPTGVVPPT